MLVTSAVVVFGVVLLPVRLSGISMEPTYHDGALNFANRLAFAWRQPARGDVVAIRMAGPSVVYVKRIVGLPGERVEITMGTVIIDGEPLARADGRLQGAVERVGPHARRRRVLRHRRQSRDDRAEPRFRPHDAERIVGKMLF